jgi:molybdopterin converting factor subunit 1
VRIEVRLFAMARDRVGRPSTAVELTSGATVAHLRRALARAHPELAPLIPALLFAIDADYATDDQPIPSGAEIAAIPPVSGGTHP